jgi:hypothetical protein
MTYARQDTMRCIESLSEDPPGIVGGIIDSCSVADRVEVTG